MGAPRMVIAGAMALSLTAGPAWTGPGDPTTRIPWTIGSVPQMIADRTGGFLVIADGYFSIRRTTLTGATSLVIPPGRVLVYDMAQDGFDGLLLRARVFDAPVQDGLWRYTPDGTLTLLRAGQMTTGLAVAPDASIYVPFCVVTTCQMLHLDPDGVPLDSVPLSDLSQRMVVHPDGTVYWWQSDGVYRLENGIPQWLFDPGFQPAGLAFDRDGWLYLVHRAAGAISLYDASLQRVTDSLATTGLAGNWTVVFATTPDGTPLARLFGATDSGLVEVNPAGVRAPGARVVPNTFAIGLRHAAAPHAVGDLYADTLSATDGTAVASWLVVQGALPDGITLDPATGALSGIFRADGVFRATIRGDTPLRFGRGHIGLTVEIPAVLETDAAEALFGYPAALSPTATRYLDIAGNDDGTYDLGDLRALLQRNGSIQ